LLQELERRLRDQRPACVCKWIDGLPLPVGAASGDRHAHWGYGAGAKAKGYKLHALCDASRHWVGWSVTPMNVNEKVVARHLVRACREEGYLVGDGEYDSNRLCELAGRHGLQMVTPARAAKGLGHRRHSVYYLRSRELAGRAFGAGLLRHRFGIDRLFGQLGNYGGGLSPLPHWVRGLSRVRRWVRAKIILDMIRWQLKQRVTA
jgi:hypothetical protein